MKPKERDEEMKTQTVVKVAITSLLLLLLFYPAQESFAAFSVSVSPYDGGYDLDYGVIQASQIVHKQVSVSVTSDIKSQYRVSNYLLSSLCNSNGDCIPAANVRVQGITGSCKYGTLTLTRDLPISVHPELYLSNSAGTSDSFTADYIIWVPADIAPGTYRGTLGFTLDPVSSTTVSSQSVNLGMAASVQSPFTVEINSSGILLISNNPSMQTSVVNFYIVGNYGRQFRIYAAPPQAAVSAEGKWLDWSAVKVAGINAKKGMAISGPTVLQYPKQILYTSSPTGERDSFDLTYSFGDLSGQENGNFKVQMPYYLEDVSTGVSNIVNSFPFEVDIYRLFQLSMTPPVYPDSIVFSNIQAGMDPQKNEVDFEVKSNTGKRYQVTQNLSANLTNKDGATIPSASFKFYLLNFTTTRGTIRNEGIVTVPKGDVVLFVSDNLGSPDKFRVIYQLTVPARVKAGEYTTHIAYSLTEL